MAYTINLSNGTTLIPGGLSDGTVDQTHSSLTLIGREYAGYGQFLNENFVFLLENFANTSSPANPLRGQLWWDTTNNVLKVYSGTSWKISTGATSAPAASPPGDLSALGGDLWFDSTNQQLKVYSGTSWVTVGPAATVATGDSGAVPALMSDISSGTHFVINFKLNGIIYAILSKDTFTSALYGFDTVKAGFNFNSNASPSMVLSTQSINATANTLVQRDSGGSINTAALTATGAITAPVITATTSLTAPSFTGTLNGNVSGATTVTATTITGSGISASSGFTGYVLSPAQPYITSTGTLVNLTTSGTTNINGTAYYNGSEIATVGGSTSFSSLNNTPIGPITPSTGAFTTLSVVTSFAPTSNLTINLGSISGGWWRNVYAQTANLINANITNASVSTLSATGNVSSSNIVTGIVTATGMITTSSSIASTGTVTVGGLLPTSNAAINIGSATSWFNIIYGKSIQAQYADLAERFASDAEYPPGTVMEIGGVAEITQVQEELSSHVFGVISTDAAYLMNSQAGDNRTHPPVAVSGRVPVRVVGFATKGDRLVSAGNGRARAGKLTEITPWNVIGRILKDKKTADEELIEAIVKINS